MSRPRTNFSRTARREPSAIAVHQAADLLAIEPMTILEAPKHLIPGSIAVGGGILLELHHGEGDAGRSLPEIEDRFAHLEVILHQEKFVDLFEIERPLEGFIEDLVGDFDVYIAHHPSILEKEERGTASTRQ